jgi:hypothetical protein
MGRQFVEVLPLDNEDSTIFVKNQGWNVKETLSVINNRKNDMLLSFSMNIPVK